LKKIQQVFHAAEKYSDEVREVRVQSMGQLTRYHSVSTLVIKEDQKRNGKAINQVS